ncbi:hypothetical protein PIB30_078180 [Stylosanthes scabra]|uniref:Uncharacterized protein n=1 Tax=Stylosanthes scabra TaxID=79078 RepID=A0ABU6WTY2_9FABA|nr:hypothetical protein [Stylosanthes scabra]
MPRCVHSSIPGFDRQSSERKWLKRAKETRISQAKPRRPTLDLVRTHPRAYAYAPIALGGTPRVEIKANVYALETPVRMHQRVSASINRGGLHHFKESPHTTSCLVSRVPFRLNSVQVAPLDIRIGVNSATRPLDSGG